MLFKKKCQVQGKWQTSQGARTTGISRDRPEQTGTCGHSERTHTHSVTAVRIWKCPIRRSPVLEVFDPGLRKWLRVHRIWCGHTCFRSTEESLRERQECDCRVNHGLCATKCEGWNWQVVGVQSVKALSVTPKFWTYDCVAIRECSTEEWCLNCIF